MADENDSTDESRWEIVYCEGWADDPANCEAAAECPDCRGTGRVLLLITEQPCETCGGTGKADACECTVYWRDDADEAVPSPQASSEQAPLIYQVDWDVEAEYGQDPEA